MGSRLALIAACLATLAVGASAHAAGTRPQPLMVGAAEDAARDGGPLGADAKMSLASLAGFDTIRITSIWSPGELEVGGTELLCLQTAIGAAQLHGIRVIVSVYPYGGRTAPVTAAARAQFASYAASIPRLVPGVRYLIVGNEPNLNRFWMPQFTPGGGDAAAALVSRPPRTDLRRDQGRRARRDGDRRLGLAARRRQPARVAADPLPTTFIRDLGLAYRQSGRTRPVMDWFSFHPYLETSKLPPSFAHPRSTTISLADFGKLRALLGRAFDGTAQKGSTLPVIYDEFGVQTRAPSRQGAHLRRRDAGRARRGRRGDAGALLPAGAAARRVPAGRRRAALLPRQRRAGARPLAVRRVLRGRHAEVEPRRGGGGGSRGTRGRPGFPLPASISGVEGQYVAYSFYRVDPAWRRLPVEERAAGKDAFAEVVESWAERMSGLRAYSCAGIRPDCDFFLWKITERYEDLGELGAELNGTPLAGWLETPYSYLATTKASQYTSARKARKIAPRDQPYLVVYPFVKVRPWYSLSEEDRQRAMDEHIRIGREEFPGITNHTTYSFGIDDQEFMTAFECDEPADFMHLMLRLRDSEASRYTERDTPIFVGQLTDIRSALDALDGRRLDRPAVGHRSVSDVSTLDVRVLVAPDSPHREHAAPRAPGRTQPRPGPSP